MLHRFMNRLEVILLALKGERSIFHLRHHRLFELLCSKRTISIVRTMNSQTTPVNSPTRSREVKSGSFDDSSGELYTREERHELAQLARGLRRVKRQLLLMQVEEPQTPATNLRELLVRAACVDPNNRSAPSSPTRRSRSSGSFDLASNSPDSSGGYVVSA